VWVTDKNTRGAYDDPFPMCFSSATRKSVARKNGGSDDNGHRLALRAHRVQRAWRAVRDALIDQPE